MKAREKIWSAVGGALILALLILIIHHYQLRFAVKNYIAELKAKGEPMELAQVIPPPVPPDKNSAPLFWKAIARFATNNDVLTTNWLTPMQEIAPGKAVISWAQPDIRYED
jgi:transposase